MFKVGDQIIFKKEKQSGVITKILSSYKVLVKSKDGFEIDVSTSDIIQIQASTNKASAYGSSFCVKDVSTERKRQHNKKKKDQKFLKIDLHIEFLTSDYQQMNNFDIVQLQLKFCEEKFKDALRSQVTKIIIVHGIGSGVLKDQVHQMLENYKVRYYLSKDGGATEIIL